MTRVTRGAAVLSFKGFLILNSFYFCIFRAHAALTATPPLALSGPEGTAIPEGEFFKIPAPLLGQKETPADGTGVLGFS